MSERSTARLIDDGAVEVRAVEVGAVVVVKVRLTVAGSGSLPLVAAVADCRPIATNSGQIWYSVACCQLLPLVYAFLRFLFFSNWCR